MIETERNKATVYPSKRIELLGGYLIEKCKKIKEAAVALDVFDKEVDNEQLLDRILTRLGEETDEETTFSEKLEKMETILYQNNVSGDTDDAFSDITYTGG